MAMEVVTLSAQTCTLYVGDLDCSVNEAQLFHLFSQVVFVVSVRVCRDRISGISLGYAYVNFSSPHDAVYARETLNFTPINGKQIRIMFSHRDPSIRKSGQANVFVKNLDQSIDNKALFEIFAAFGVVLSCKVALDNNGQSKGHGFVNFDKKESAVKAIEKLDGMLINDKRVYVGFFVKRKINCVNGSPQFTNVFIKNLPERCTDNELKEFFEKLGSITSCVVMKDENGKSKCFGFVNFENPNDAASAVEKLNGVSMGEKVLYVGKAQRKSEREAELKARFEEERRRRFEQLQGTNLYMKNLDDSLNDERLKELFSNFGTVTSCKVMVNARGVSKGYAFVAFSTKEEANKAMNEMNGKTIGRKPLYVSVAERKEDRKARLQALYAQQLIGATAPMPFTNGFHPVVSPGIAANPQQLYVGQGGIVGGGDLIHGVPQPVAATGYGYHQQFFPGSYQFTNFILPYQQFPRQVVPRRFGSRRGGNNNSQTSYQNSNTGFIGYNGNGRNNRNQSVFQRQALVGSVMQFPVGGSMDVQYSGPLPVSTLSSVVAAATPEMQET